MESVDLTEPGADDARPGRPRSTSPFCTARSKRSGQGCRRRVVGGGVCAVHGGKAPQVARAREARLALAEARSQVLFGGEYEQRDPGAVLLAAVADADSILQQLKRNLERSGELTAHELDGLGSWLDRVARLSKATIDSAVAERLAMLQEQANQGVGEAVSGVLLSFLRRLGLDDERHMAVMREELSALRSSRGVIEQ